MPRSPDIEFLRACCRGNRSADFPSHLQEISRRIASWSSLIDLLVFHGIDPLVYARIAGAGAVPKEVLGVLSDRAAQNAAASLGQLAELTDVLDGLSSAGVAAVALNGPLMAATLYGNSSLHRSAELRLLIREADRAAARKALERQGYLLETPVDSDGRPRDSSNHSYLFDAAEKTLVKLEWGIPRARAVAVDSILSRCQSAEVAGVQSLLPAPEDLFILLNVNGAEHRWEQWIWLCDLDAVSCSNPGLDWNLVWERAASLGLEPVIRSSLILLHDLLEAPVPSKILALAREDEQAAKLAAEAGACLLGPDTSADEQAPAPAGRQFAPVVERESVAKPATSDTPEGKLVLRAYRLSSRATAPVPAPRPRAWMEQTDDRFANRCLPLLMANQAGWHILNTHAIEAEWDGGNGLDSVRIRVLSGEGECPIQSHFGHGVITWSLALLFRTPPGYNLWVRGPANSPKDGVYALEGLVETDWSPATFTMNWRFTRPGHVVRFEEGEPICCVLPIRRGELEEFDAVIQDIADAPELSEAYRKWSLSRKVFLDLMKSPESRPKEGWQKHYFHGRSPAGDQFDEHQNKLRLHAFREPGQPPSE